MSVPRSSLLVLGWSLACAGAPPAPPPEPPPDLGPMKRFPASALILTEDDGRWVLEFGCSHEPGTITFADRTTHWEIDLAEGPIARKFHVRQVNADATALSGVEIEEGARRGNDGKYVPFRNEVPFRGSVVWHDGGQLTFTPPGFEDGPPHPHRLVPEGRRAEVPEVHHECADL